MKFVLFNACSKERGEPNFVFSEMKSHLRGMNMQSLSLLCVTAIRFATTGQFSLRCQATMYTKIYSVAKISLTELARGQSE